MDSLDLARNEAHAAYAALRSRAKEAAAAWHDAARLSIEASTTLEEAIERYRSAPRSLKHRALERWVEFCTTIKQLNRARRERFYYYDGDRRDYYDREAKEWIRVRHPVVSKLEAFALEASISAKDLESAISAVRIISPFSWYRAEEEVVRRLYERILEFVTSREEYSTLLTHGDEPGYRFVDTMLEVKFNELTRK